MSPTSEMLCPNVVLQHPCRVMVGVLSHNFTIATGGARQAKYWSERLILTLFSAEFRDLATQRLYAPVGTHHQETRPEIVYSTALKVTDSLVSCWPWTNARPHTRNRT